MDEGSFDRARWGLSDVCACEQLESRVMLAVWDGGPTGLGVDWNDPVNWQGDVLPLSGEDVTIAAGPGSAIQFGSGSLSLHSISSERPLTLTGGSLGVTAGATVSGGVNLQGGALQGGTWALLGQGLVANESPGNTLDSVTINGDVALVADNAFVRVTGGLTVNGLVAAFGDGATVSFDGGSQTLAGNADILFEGFSGFRYVSADAGAVLTIAASVTFTGERGRITSGHVSGTGTIVNQGTIWADAADGTITISPTVFTNLGTLRATSDGILKIAAGTWTNSGVLSINGGTIGLGGTFNITAGYGSISRSGGSITIDGTLINTGATLALNAGTGSWRFNGGQIIGGTISVNANQSLTVFPLVSGRIAQATINGPLSWTIDNVSVEFDGVTLNGDLAFGGFSTLIVKNTLTLNGTITVTGTDGLVRFDTPSQQILGNATILMRNELAYLWAFSSLTIPIGTTISGYGRLFGEITNQGSVLADRAGKVLMIATGTFANSGTVRAISNGILALGDNVGSSTAVTNSSVWEVDGASMVIGPTSQSGPIAFSNSGSFVARNSATVQAGNQLVLNLIEIHNAASFDIQNGASVILGTVQQVVPVSFSNTGIVTASSGGSINFKTLVTTAQVGDSRASGGSVILSGLLDNTAAALNLNNTSGTWDVMGGRITGGIISFSGPATLRFDASLSNVLDAVTVSGALEITNAGARIGVMNGLTLNGSIHLSGVGSGLAFKGGVQALNGMGTVLFQAGKSGHFISADDGAAVSIGAGITVTGSGGSLRSGAVFGGSGSFTNLGKISGSLTINAAAFTNSGVVEAAKGAMLTVQGGVTNYSAGTLTGGTWNVGSGSEINFTPGPITSNGATITLDGSNAVLTALNSLAANMGTLKLSSSRDLALPGSLTNSGVLDLGPGTDLSISGAFTQTAPGITRISMDTGNTPNIIATGAASVGGTLQGVWLHGRYPRDGTTVPFLSAAAVVGVYGAFTSTNLGPNRAQSLNYTPSQVSLRVSAVVHDDDGLP